MDCNKNAEKWASKENVELLNTLTYNNYGLLLNSNSIDISITNRLAICTDKSIFILNQNFEWPSALNNSSPFKFFLNNKKSQNQQNKQHVHIDQWIQDLIDTKNDAYFINIIRSVPKSTKFLNIFKQFFNLDEYKQSKHKSFQKQLQFMCKRLINNESKNLTKDLKEYNLKSLEDENSEEFKIHKTILDQTKLFDLDYYEFLSFLNPFSSGASQENNLQDAFKFCKWNKNPKHNFLFTLTQYNQMLLFDCTRIKFDNTVNHLNANNQDIQTNLEYLKIFDLKSKSKMINLTDYYIVNNQSALMTYRFRNIDDFIQNVNKICPKVINWGPKVYSNNGVEYEILLIGFKSNQIGVFYVYSDLNVEFNKLIDLNDKLKDYSTQDECIDTNMIKIKKCLLSEIKLSENGILGIGLNNGGFLFGRFDDLKFELLDTKKMIGSILKIDFLTLENDDYLILIETSSQLGFFLMSKNKSTSYFIYDFNVKRYSEFNQEPIRNYLIQGSFKLIEYKILSKFKFLLIFENSYIDLIEIKIENSHIEFVGNTLLNNSMDINFDPKINPSQNEVFKTTRQMFLTKNKFMLYQINDFTKSSLIHKRPANFQINIYKLKNINVEELSCFLDPIRVDANQQCIKQADDFIWLFNHDLFLKNDSLIKHIYSFLYENFKSFRSKLNTFSNRSDKLIYLKRLRILAYLMCKYYESVSNFDIFNSKIEVDIADESSEESDCREEDEIDAENTTETENKHAVKQETEDSIVKTASFYDLIFRETSLLIFKFHCIDFLTEAYKKSYEALENSEKVLVILIGDFCIRKNFLQNFNSNEVLSGDLEKWLKEKTKKSSESNELSNFLINITCDLCGKRFTNESNLNLNKIKCESGHYMNRCEKTLLPLNNFKYKKCCMCDSKWNFVEIEKGFYKNFANFFLNRLDNCLYCD